MNPFNMFGRGGQKQVIHDLLQGISQQQLARMQHGYNPGGFQGDFVGMSPERLQQIAKMMQAGQSNGLDPMQFFLQHHQGDGLFAGGRGQMRQGDPFRNTGQQNFPGGGGPGPGPIGTPGGPPLGGPTIVGGPSGGGDFQGGAGGIIPGRGFGRPPFAGGIGRGRPIMMQPLNQGMHAMLLARALGR